ncbi:basic leucine zipper 61 [Salvia miltiorrhiza]|uniref:basic leucine zipper 61 n=1 Tax=Salvia miltiorrhiza TaxID=226208 RepID=UPI0025AB9A23|nr:basic leucine zipper 61 [Salvia miltiorrhiza]XP_057778684.1 basic leucine zipper 61 [Salvia miltiorrhiza]
MSRHAQLPPRCPLQKKTVAPQVNASVSPFSGIDTELHSRQIGQYKIPSESFILDEQPPWLNDLLNDLDLDTDSSLPDLDQLSEKETTELDDELGSYCMYGPNSPRMRNMLGFPENEIASAFSEYAVQNSPQHLDGYSSISGVQSDSYRDARASVDEIISDKKRHPGQRSRARKLQYIFELERTVNVLQNLGAELAVRVASLIQQHAALSLENNTLNQRLLRMKQEQFIVDNEYETLKIEVERLRSGLAVSTAVNKFLSTSRSRSIDGAIWDMLEMHKLNLN